MRKRVVVVCVWCVFASQGAGNAAATSPARGGGRLAASSPRSAIARLPSGASPSPCIPPSQAGSAKGGGIPRPAHSVSAEPVYGRRCGAPPAPPPVAGSAASRLPPSASPAVTASASCRRPSSPLRTDMAREEKRVTLKTIAFSHDAPRRRWKECRIYDCHLMNAFGRKVGRTFAW